MKSSLQRRLRLGLSAIALALVVLAAVSIGALNQLGTAVATILRENYESVLACERMKEALQQQNSAYQLASSGRDDVARPMLKVQRAAFDRAFARESANVTLPGEGELVEEIRREYAAYVALVDAALGSAPELRGGRAREASQRFDRLEARIQRVLDMNQDAMLDADRAAKRLASRTQRLAVGVSAALILLAVFLAVWLPRLIVRPLEALTATANAIGEGDFGVRVAEPAVAELVPLAREFDSMREKLRAYQESSLGELLAARDVAQATLECLQDPVVVFDASGAVRYANGAAGSAFGLSAGAPESDVEVPAAVAEARDAVLATGEPVLPRALAEAMRWRTADGERDYLVRAMPLPSEAREPARAIVIAQEVTRLRRIDELKSDLVATVSHQFKTPLTSLRMATHMLLEPAIGALSDGQRELVVTARDETERLRTMVEDLLDVVRIESGAGELRRVAIDPHAFLSEVAAAHRPLAKDAGVALEVDRESPLAPLEIDPERLGIAVANLVSNAVRHTRRGGRVTLSASRRGALSLLHVRDEGDGIPPDQMALLFDRPTTAPSSSPASAPRHGLGLTIAREIVLQHGGELTATSEPGRGSVFSISIPAS